MNARWCTPTLSIVDVRTGDNTAGMADAGYRFGPTRFSVIPCSAIGNVSIRFVPDQTADELIAALRWFSAPADHIVASWHLEQIAHCQNESSNKLLDNAADNPGTKSGLWLRSHVREGKATRAS